MCFNVPPLQTSGLISEHFHAGLTIKADRTTTEKSSFLPGNRAPKPQLRARRSPLWSLPPQAARERKHKARPMSFQGLRGSRQLSILGSAPTQPWLELLSVRGTSSSHPRQDRLDSGAITSGAPGRAMSPAPQCASLPSDYSTSRSVAGSAYPLSPR